jgi:hypothetical protein
VSLPQIEASRRDHDLAVIDGRHLDVDELEAAVSTSCQAFMPDPVSPCVSVARG